MYNFKDPLAECNLRVTYYITHNPRLVMAHNVDTLSIPIVIINMKSFSESKFTSFLFKNKP